MSTPILENDFLLMDESVFEVVCDKRRPDCTQPADWIIRCRRCSHPTFLCNRHLVILRGAKLWTCLMCRGKALRFEDIAEVTPLKGLQ